MRRWGCLVLVPALLLAGRDARAQVRWDTGLQGGVSGRFLSSRPAGEAEPSIGPTFAAVAHVALVPLVRLGAYVDLDGSSVGVGATTVVRQIVSGGIDLRLMSPWPTGDWRTYLRTGIGEAGVIAHPSGGHFTEVPLALGVAYRLVAPVWLTAEAGVKLGFGFAGWDYGGGGDDVLDLYGMLGVAWGR